LRLDDLAYASLGRGPDASFLIRRDPSSNLDRREEKLVEKAVLLHAEESERTTKKQPRERKEKNKRSSS